MTKKIFCLLKQSVTVQGQEVAAGEIVELSELSAKALINDQLAVEADPDNETAEALKKQQEDDQGNQDDDPAADEEKLRKALDDQYTLEEMKPVAKEAGVDFSYNVTKKDLVAAIIEQGKAEAVLK